MHDILHREFTPINNPTELPMNNKCEILSNYYLPIPRYSSDIPYYDRYHRVSIVSEANYLSIFLANSEY